MNGMKHQFSNVIKQMHPIQEIIGMLEENFQLYDEQYNYPSLGRCSILHVAVVTRNIALVQHLVNRMRETNSDMLHLKSTTSGQTPLHVALELFSLPNITEELTKLEALLTILLDCKLNFENVINETDEQGLTPLHTAVMSNVPIHLVELLIHRGANLFLKTNNGENVLHLCAIRTCISLAQFFLIQIAKQSIIHENNAQIPVLSLLDRNQDGLTPLHIAAKVGSDEMCSLLLTTQQEVSMEELLSVRTNDGKTPYDLARDAGHERCAILLRQYEQNEWVILDEDTTNEQTKTTSTSSKFSFTRLFDSVKNIRVALPDMRPAKSIIPQVSLPHMKLPSMSMPTLTTLPGLPSWVTKKAQSDLCDKKKQP